MSKGVLGYGNALAEAAGVLKDVIEKLASRRGILWFQALKEFLRSPLVLPMDTESQMERLRSLYRHTFGIDLGEVVIPERKPGFSRLIVVAQGVTTGQVFNALGRRLNIQSDYEGIDAWKMENERNNATTYAIWARNVVEADEDLKNFDAYEICVRRFTTETFLERLLHELIYSEETGGHLDMENATLCTGSRCLVDRVPNVRWLPDDRKLWVGVNAFRCGGPNLRAREVVALPPQTS